MKINKKILINLVRESVRSNIYGINEIVAYSPGMKDLQKVDYPECKIEIPPVFKAAFLENKGADANTIRSIMGKEFSKLGTTTTGTSEKTIAVIESVFSDNNINNIVSMINKIANVGGVPAVYCMILQKAIDAFAKLVDVYHDKLDTEEGKKEPAFIKIIADYMAFRDWPSAPTIFNAVIKKDNTIGTSIFKSSITTLYFSGYIGYLETIEAAVMRSKKLPASADVTLEDNLAKSYITFNKRKDKLVNRIVNSVNFASDYITLFFNEILNIDPVPDEIIKNVINKLNAYEKTLNQQNALRYRQEIKNKMLQLAESLYANSFNFMTDEIIQEHFEVLNKKDFYEDTKKLFSMMKSIAEK